MQTHILRTPSEKADRAFGTAIGILFLGSFGMLWILIGLLAPGPIHLPEIVIATGPRQLIRVLPPACCYVALVAVSLMIFRRTAGARSTNAGSEERRKINRWFAIVNIVQWGLIIGAIAVLNRIGQSGWTVPSVVLIVGLHFYPLAVLFHDRTDYVTGTALVLWAALYPFLRGFSNADPRGAVVTGIILWVSAFFSAWQALRLLRAASLPA